MDENRVILVTGASGGIGEAVAYWLGRAGATVVLLARRADALDRVALKIRGMGADVHTVCADVSNPEECQTGVEETIERFKRLDSVVNNAGILDPLTMVADTDLKKWRHNLEVNLLGPLYLIQSSIPYLRSRNGRVINISSGAAYHPIYAGSAYCASKAGLNQLTSVLAKEEPRITFLAVRPGVVDTDMQARIRKEGPSVMPPDEIGYYQSLKKRGDLEPPEIPARSLAWLALAAPREFSGRFMSYDDPEIRAPARNFFKETVD